MFGEGITQNSLPLYEDKIYLKLKSGDFIYLSEFNSNNETKTIRSLNSEIYSDIKLYEDKSISALGNRDSTNDNLLWLNSGNKTSEFILPDELNKEVFGYFFEPTQKLFYLTSMNRNVFYIDIILNNNEIYPFFETTLIDSSFKIFKINTVAEKLYLKNGTNQCKEISMDTKQFKEVNCNLINVNNLGFKVFPENNTLYRLEDNNTKTKLIELDPNFIYSNIETYKDSLYYIKYLRTNIEQKQLIKLNLDNNSETILISSLPSVSIIRIFILNGNIHLIVRDPIAKIIRYFPDPLKPIQGASSTPISYPTYPKPYIGTNFSNWYEINLGFVPSEIEIVE